MKTSARLTLRKKIILLSLLASLIVYISSYYVVSRAALQFAEEHDIKGFYFFLPHDSAEYRVNYRIYFFYYPLVQVDYLLGTGRPFACEPLLRLGGR